MRGRSRSRNLVHVDGGVSGQDAHESAFQAQVKRLAIACGWLYYHTNNSERSDKGFPDTVMVRDDRVIFAELKLDRNYSEPSIDQQVWLAALAATPVEVYLWRPSMIAEIRDTLNRPDPFIRTPTYAELQRELDAVREHLAQCEAEALDAPFGFNRPEDADMPPGFSAMVDHLVARMDDDEDFVKPEGVTE